MREVQSGGLILKGEESKKGECCEGRETSDKRESAIKVKR